MKYSRGPGYLLAVTIVYFTLGMIDLFLIPGDWLPWLQIIWVVVISLPLWVKPLADKLNMKVIWDL
jgi:hypothetical protein